jgi:methylamine utilization protein MauE
MGGLLASLVAGTALLAAAAMKAAEPAASRVALGGFGLAFALWPLVVVEAVAGVLVLGGVADARFGAAALFGVFALAQAGALAAGRGGAPCGCLGGRGTISWLGALRALGLAAVALFATGGGPVAAAAGAVAAALVAFMLHRAPRGALDVAHEGPALGTAVEAPGSGARVLLFTASGCRLCARVRRGLRRGAEVSVVELDEERDAGVWLALRVPGAPYAVALDAAGVVQAKGTVNTAAQVRSLLPRPDADSRRGFLTRAAAGAAALAAADTVAKLVRPGEAEAFHFCGHIYTTDSCPHPTGLPRIDSHGYPLRARDGHPVDDLGRPIDKHGYALDDHGHHLVDPDGRRLPRAPRTKVCTATGRRYGFHGQLDGAWYRCCKGHVRKLVDCCGYTATRINGDASLTGYCYGGRHVFCVMFHQTRVPC